MAEFNISAVCIVSDPKELQRQWSQVYRLLMELPFRNGNTEHERATDATEPSVDIIPGATEG